MGRLSWLVLVGTLALVAPGAAAEPDLPRVASGHRPGPDALYAPPPKSVPQLENVAPWTAEPILVSGAQAYRDGEFLYQDFLFDDHGATGAKDPNDPHGIGDFLFAPTAGTLTYPRDPVFANNAADLVELRVKPLPDATAIRVTLNTLQDPERTAFTIAIGNSGDERAWPHGANVSSPAELFLTVHGANAELVDAASGAAKTPPPTAAVHLERRQIDVRIPHAAYDPGTAKVRLAAGVGLWDKAANAYRAPEHEATETTPGGASGSGAALFNVAFRFDEPMPDVTQFGAGVTIADAAAGATVDAAWWREKAQAQALADGDVSRFFAEVDFGRLAAEADDESRVPKTGPINRILASRHSFGQGIDHTKVCFDIGADIALGAKCEGRQVGQLQAYALYVPAKPQPKTGWGLTLLLHSLSANYNQYSASRNQSQLGDRGAGTLVATPGGRGPDGFYAGIPEADTFEVWADVARHYALDPDWAVVSGYSMGGFGTYRLLARWPDLFARGMSTVGEPGTVEDQMESLRNTPIMAWAAAADELVHVTETEKAARQMGELGLRFIADLFPTADHLTLATNDEYGPAAEFLGEHRVDRNPPHVSYVVDAGEDSAAAATVADHAYWLSGLRVGDSNAVGKIDARSEAFGVGEPRPTGVETGGGVLAGGSHGPLPYAHRVQEWVEASPATRNDRIVIRTTNLAAATIDAGRARLSCAPQLDVSADRPLDLKIACPPAKAASCAKTVSIKLPRVRGRRITSVAVIRGKRTIKRARGRSLRRVVVRRPTRGAFTLRIRARTTGRGSTRTVTLTRRFGRCTG